MSAISAKEPADAAPPARAEDVRSGIALILASSALFAVMNAGVKLLSDRLGPIEIGFFRQVFSLIPIAIFIARQGGPAMLATQRPLGHLFRGFIGNIAMIVFFFSLAWLPLADATALSFASPLFVTAMSAPLLGESVGRHRWSVVMVGFAGVVVMTHPGGNWLSPGSGAGAGMGVLAAFMTALMMITIRQLSRTEPPVTIVFYFVAIGCLMFGLLLPFFWVTPTLWEFAGMAAVGLIGGLSQLTLTHAYRNAPASLLAPFGYVSILWSTLLGFALWRQLPGQRVLAGAAIVTASGLYIIYREARRRSRIRSQPLAIPG